MLTFEQFLPQVAFTMIAEQSDVAVRGNAMASGDDEADKKVEDEILERLNNGDLWAWADVEVKATWKELEASDYLGACNYESEANFIQEGDYYDDMKLRAAQELYGKYKAIVEAVA